MDSRSRIPSSLLFLFWMLPNVFHKAHVRVFSGGNAFTDQRSNSNHEWNQAENPPNIPNRLVVHPQQDK